MHHCAPKPRPFKATDFPGNICFRASKLSLEQLGHLRGVAPGCLTNGACHYRITMASSNRLAQLPQFHS